MTSADVRDMLDLPSDGHPRPVKKQKTVEKRPEGITRELFALLGERAPPVAITDHVKYKERPKWSHKVQPWEMIPFTNPAREDGLVLRHWRRKRDPNATAPSATPTDGNEIIPAVPDNGSSEAEFEYYFAKFNVKVNGPRYDEAQYNAHLQSEDWSMAETDYLVHLALDYDLRWIVIADRYDYEPTTGVNGDETSTALVPAAKRRTMEDMKARYYDIAAKIMSLHRPVSTMSAAEFDLHEKMTKFNSRQETDRKRLAEALLSRSLDEIKEEEILLGELKRIVGNEEKFLQERKELYARLESPHSSGNTAMYQSSHGLGQLMQTLLNADKSKKRRSLIGPGDTASSPAVGSSGQNFAGQREGRDSGHRDSIGGSSMKKGSISGSSAQRPLTAKEEEKYGVSHHERLTSGVQFRHDKVTKLGQAKSNVQASKISAALTELQIPPRLVMPTARVCAEYERLILSIHTLLDVRKLFEKVEGEIKVCEAQREEKERKERADIGELPQTPPTEEYEVPKKEVDEDEEEGEEEEEHRTKVEEADGASEDARVSAAPSPRGGRHKRSASVMSGVSEKSTKRQRK